MGRVLRKELEGDDIRVTTITPGGFTTNLGRGFLPESQQKMGEALARLKIDPTGPDRQKLMGDPQQVVKIIRYVLEQPIEINLSEITIRPAISLNMD